jgi:hypothetical protein
MGANARDPVEGVANHGDPTGALSLRVFYEDELDAGANVLLHLHRQAMVRRAKQVQRDDTEPATPVPVPGRSSGSVTG